MRELKIAVCGLLFGFGLTVGCAQFGLIPAGDDVASNLLYAYSTNATVRNAAADATNAKVISKSTAQQVLATTNTVREAADEVKKAVCPNMNAQGSAVDVSQPACMSGVPESMVAKAKFAAGLAKQAFELLQRHGVLK